MIFHHPENENMFTEREALVADIHHQLNFCPNLLHVSPVSKASRGDVGHAVGLLTSQPAEVQDPGDSQDPAASGETWEGHKGTLEPKHT